MPLDTALLDEITRNHFEPGLLNEVTDSFVLLNRLKAEAKQETLVGPRLEWELVSKRHESMGLLSGYQEMADQQIKPTAKATLEPAFYYASVGISAEEEAKNSGSMEKLLGILQTQVENARESLTEMMATDAFGLGTTVDGMTPLIGLRGVISATSTYAGINRTTAANAFFRGNVNSSAHTSTNLQDSTNASYLPRILRSSYTAATHSGAPNLGITTKSVYNLYMDIAGTKLNTFKELADLGFGGAEFMGGAMKMAFDDYCPANHFFMLNMKYWALWVYAGYNMNSDGWTKPSRQAARVTHFLWMGQLQCRSPRRQAMLSDIQAP